MLLTASHSGHFGVRWDLNRPALVTGAGGGIGRACVEQLIRDGCTRLLITDVRDGSLAETAQLATMINPNVEVLVESADISQENAARRLIDIVTKRFGRLDYALNVAGVGGESKPIVDIPTDGYDFVQNINAKAVWLCEKAQVAQMLKQDPLPTHDGRPGNRGAIVNLASTAGHLGFPNSTPYVMSKHTVVGLVKSDSSTYASHGIRVNAVCPGVVDTQMVRAGPPGFAETFVETFTPMKRLGTPQEIADVVVFLCSSRATYVSGASFIVDGGQTAL